MSITPAAVRDALRDFIHIELLGGRGVKPATDAPLITNGVLDSMALAQVSVFIENAFGIIVPNAEITVANFDTIDSMLTTIMKNAHG